MNIQTLNKYIADLKTKKSALEGILSRYGIDYGKAGTSLFTTECNSLKHLKVAAIMDPFTLGNFESECELLNISADNWMEELENFMPDLFFLESAWEGKDKSWYRKIANGSKELYDLTAYCHANGIPIIFWNKEDPVYTDTFMSAAACADFVFTTDFDCIERYKKTLQHNNVYLLHFSAQPLVHNPIEMHDRKDKFCFAGAYYHRYKERSMVFDAFADAFEKGKGLEIFDRNLGSARPEHAFPQRYNKMIVGTLSPEDIHIAYKGYNYGINMNSVSQSQTMFARRVYELLASNTVSVGNYSRGVKNLFGDLTVATNDVNTMVRHLDTYCKTDSDYRKFRLLGLRKVMKEHLCEDRLGFIASCVFGKDMKQQLPLVTVVSAAETADEKQKVQASFDRQTYTDKKLVFINDEKYKENDGFIAAFSPDDYYGENYLTDLVLSVRYSDADGFGKNHYYTKTKADGAELNGTDGTYKPCRTLYSTRSIVKSNSVSDIKAFAHGTLINGNFLCTDEFNYCAGCTDNSCPVVDDIFVADQGIALSVINETATKIDYQNLKADEFYITPSELCKTCPPTLKAIKADFSDGKFTLNSSLVGDAYEYIYFKAKYNINELSSDNTASIVFNGMGDASAEGFCFFFDADMQRLGYASARINKAIEASIPENTKYFSIVLRIRGEGKLDLTGVTAKKANSSTTSTPFLSRSGTIVIADHYPSYDDLYRYMFVHKRNILYKENNLVPDMMRINMWNATRYSEFEGINVTDGNADKLTEVLESGTIKTLCVHFLNPYLWSVLKNYLDEINLIVWSHGSDIQPWHRRSYNYTTKDEIEEAKKASEEREVFWDEVFKASEEHNIRFVFVSEFFKKQIEEDYNVDLSDRCSIIHNCIDTQMFSYKKKNAEQRFNIMSVKSFSTLTYANDITQEAIVILSKTPEFSKMTFDLYGDGERFEEDTRQLKKFKNVHLHKVFLTQSDIAKLHQSHGIYIATTRMDTQGVSRDEAMSSGLVPIASAVAAIPEFVDNSCGMLVPGEDPQAVADAILKVVRNPELFSALSENAAKKVRGLTSKEFTIDKEINLIESRKNL
ncbi:MAG: glycosyltransferase [Clostridia bacterium]|nr:glycosyltransferase [Clostridia bacterium]